MKMLSHRRRFRRLRISMFQILLLLPLSAHADGPGTLTWLSWTALQTIPSPTFTFDSGNADQQVLTSLRWQVTPISYSWSANELVSAVSFLKVNPVRRHAGSAELFAQPELALTDFQKVDLRNSSFAFGSRAFLPVDECGEYLSVSLGARYILRKSLSGAGANTFAGEIGVYTLFGIIGMQLGIAADPATRYSLSIYLKYY